MESKILGSRYELLERVGMGGMAVVYKATDKMLKKCILSVAFSFMPQKRHLLLRYQARSVTRLQIHRISYQ